MYTENNARLGVLVLSKGDRRAENPAKVQI